MNSSLSALVCEDYLSGNASYDNTQAVSYINHIDIGIYNSVPNSGTFEIGAYFCRGGLFLITGINAYGGTNDILYSSLIDKPTCPINSSWDIASNSCINVPCTPIAGSDALPNIQQQDCNGSLSLVVDGIGTNYTELVWQDCDSTCYGVPLSFYTCNDLKPSYQNQCTANEVLQFVCSDATGIGIVNEFETKCYSKISPCDTELQNIKNSCNLDTSTIQGQCTDNGMAVTFSSLECVANVNGVPPVDPNECLAVYNEVFNSTTQQCECASGYEVDTFGGCSLPLDANATEQQQAEKKKNDAIQAINKTKTTIDTNTSNNQQIADKTQNDTLAGIRADNNVSNSLLSQIANALSLTDEEKDSTPSYTTEDIDARNGWFDSVTAEFNTFDTNVKGQLSQIDTMFTDTKSIFSANHTITVYRGVSAPCISFMFHGKLIEVDLCASFSKFSSIVYFVFTILFMVISFRFTANNLLKGLD